MDIENYCKKKYEELSCNSRVIQCLELNISETCNYNCEYCIFWRYDLQQKMMTPQMAAEYTDKYGKYLKSRRGKIYLGAGEPLLNWDAIISVNETIKKYGYPIDLCFMTNGSLLTHERLDYIHANHIQMGLSLDGHPTFQNQFRPAKDSTIDSFSVIIDALEYSKKIGYPIYSLSATYRIPHFYDEALFVLSLCKKYGIQEFDLDYDISALKKNSIDVVAKNLYDVWKKADALGLSVFGYWLIPYINSLNSDRIGCYCGNAKATNICISASGTLHICGYDPVSYGQISTFENLLDNAQYYNKLKTNISSICSDRCHSCELLALCHGQCIFQDRNSESAYLNCQLLKAIMMLFS